MQQFSENCPWMSCSFFLVFYAVLLKCYFFQEGLKSLDEDGFQMFQSTERILHHVGTNAFISSGIMSGTSKSSLA